MSLLSQLQNRFPDLTFQAEVPLAPYTYMKVGGPAEVLWQAKQYPDFKKVAEFVQREQLPVTILGGASNVVVRDGGIRGLVILNGCDAVTHAGSLHELFEDNSDFSEEIQKMAENHQVLLAESGIKTALLVRKSVDFGLTGLEPFLGVPGTLGGAVFNNSHYTEELIGNYIAGVEAVDEHGTARWLTNSQCDFRYDHSRFHHFKEIILRALFALKPGDRELSMQKIAQATVKRATTQPLGTANSGCMFQNVVLDAEQQERFGKKVLSAGWLIDQAGLKGMRVGDAVVSTKHANFVVNEGNATFRDIETLVQKVQEEIQRKFGLSLKQEVFFIGEEGRGA